MKFYNNQIFHIFNQGNNKEKIFFNHDNYIYFLRKIREHILPHADILCYCLMPNHFHLLIYLKELEINISNSKTRTLNTSIGIMLMSYTNGVNKQQGRTGSLFRQKTKIKDGGIENVITSNGINKKFLFHADNQYGRTCFDYIHENPVKAKLTIKAEDWEYSSAKDYKGLRDGTLCNKELTYKLLFE